MEEEAKMEEEEVEERKDFSQNLLNLNRQLATMEPF